MSVAEGLKSVAKLIPGVTGYMTRNDLRNTDKVVRGHVVQSLEAVKRRVEGVQRAMVDEKKLGTLPALDRVCSRIARVRNRVMNAAYGDSSFFSEARVDESVLGRLIEFDKEMGERCVALAAEASALESTGVDEAGVKAAAGVLEQSVQRLDELFTSRDSILAK